MVLSSFFVINFVPGLLVRPSVMDGEDFGTSLEQRIAYIARRDCRPRQANRGFKKSCWLRFWRETREPGATLGTSEAATQKRSAPERRGARIEELVKRIAVIAGDGVGPEVVAESEKLLSAISAVDGEIEFSFDHFPWGSDYYFETGTMMPSDGLQTLMGYDAILFGAVGSPRIPDHVTLRQLLFPIRKGFDQYVNLRPVRLLPSIETPLKGRSTDDIDMVFVREGTEGEYAGLGDRLYPGTEREVALQTAAFSRFGTLRVIRWAFDLGRKEGRKVTSVSKGNALQYSGVLWDEIFREVAAEYPDVETDELLVDAAAMFLVREPQRFGVVVASNLYADILTDLGAAIAGGMGIAPSANLNPERRFPSMFEPIHGSAPDIAGRGISNPIGSMWSTAMMLGHLGYSEWESKVMEAIEETLGERGSRTVDLGGIASTEEVGDAVVTALKNV
jgi:tartrate dehydrogenase/decarboxylase / D-malate dehydrogenase